MVIPGELIAEGDYSAGDNTYREEDRVYASRIGLARYVGKRVDVVALKGCYVPSVGDLVIGKVIDVELNGWLVDINAPYNAYLSASDAFERPFNPRRDELTRMFNIGDLLLAKVLAFDRTRDPVLSIRGPKLGKITHGRVIKITPTKIPRLIGRKGSMINLLKKQTGSHIVVGQNGLILISSKKPEGEALAIQAIRTIETEAHTSGLTDRIGELIKRDKMKRGG